MLPRVLPQVLPEPGVHGFVHEDVRVVCRLQKPNQGLGQPALIKGYESRWRKSKGFSGGPLSGIRCLFRALCLQK